MKKFIKKTLLILILPAITCILFFLLFNGFVSKQYSKFQLDSNVSRIFIGDSHINKCINDSIIPNSLNLSENSESFYFSYYKLKLILENNPSIKEVYLGLGYHSLSKYYDEYIFGPYSRSVSPKYFYLLPNKEQLKMFWATIKSENFHHFFRSIIKQGVLQVTKKNYYPFLGDYDNSIVNSSAVISAMDKRLRQQFYKNGIIIDFSDINIKYLYKIDSLCSLKNVKLFTVNTPLFNYYERKVPNEYKNKLSSIVKNKHLEPIDLSNLLLNEEYFMADGDHVSLLGAEATSIALKKIIIQPPPKS